MKKFLEKYGAYVVAGVVFVVMGYVYCKPQLSGKVIYAGDNINAVSAVHETARYTDPADGEYGFWNGSMFSGMPNYQIGGGHYKSEDLIGSIKGFFHRGPGSPAWIFIFYFLSFFVLLRTFKVDKWLCIVGAIAIALSSYFIVIIAAGHGGKTIAISYISLVAAGFYLIFRKKYALGAIFTMFFTAIGFSIHPQMAYYLYMMIGLFFFAEIYTHAKEKRWKDLIVGSLIFVASLGIGMGTGCSNIFANKEYAEQTMRGGHSDLVKAEEEAAGVKPSKGLDLDYATQWSYGIDETMSFMIPGFMGGSSNYPVGKDSQIYKTMVKQGVPSKTSADFCRNVPMYWGDQPFTSGNVYMGAIVCFLFLLGCLIVKGPYKWALLSSTLFSVALAWGHNFMPLTELFFKYFPLYNKFRAVSSILIVAEVAMPLLGFLALKAIMDGDVEKQSLRKNIFISAGVTGGLCLFFALFGGGLFSFTSQYDAQFAQGLPDWLYSAIIDERRDLLRGDSWRSFLFIAASALIVWLFAKEKLQKSWFIAILGILIVADMWPVDKRYFNDDYFVTRKNNDAAFAMKPYEKTLLEDSDPHFRIMDLTTSPFNDARPSYYLKSIGGYNAAKLRRYQDLIDEHLSKLHLPVIGMLNAKYIITEDSEGNAVPQLNPYALGNAWFVSDLAVVEGANQEIDALGNIDLSRTAVLDKEFASYVSDTNPGIAPDAFVGLVKYHPRFIDYACKSSTPGTIVFSEIYYPYGWKASIDGAPVDHYRVNYMLRALNVPAGEHLIHFEFAPDSVRKGDIIATICILIMYAVILGSAGYYGYNYFRKRKSAQCSSQE